MPFLAFCFFLDGCGIDGPGCLLDVAGSDVDGPGCLLDVAGSDVDGPGCGSGCGSH